MSIRTPRLGWLVAAALTFACSGEPPAGEAGGVAITVSPLTLPGVTRAVYTLTVENDGGETVMSRQLDSNAYGAGGGLSYVAPCDADANDNTLTLTVDALYSGAGGVTPVPAGEWVDPGPMTRDVTCVANADVPVTFDITVLRAAEQGFFDISVDFSDVFCSAKLDCDGTNAFPGFETDTTVVLAFVCTAGPGTDTTLYLDDIDVACDGGTATIDPSAGPGRLSVGDGISGVAGIIDAAAVYRGQQQLEGAARYWNVAFAIDPAAANCTLTTDGTASEEPLTALTTAADAVYPYVSWEVDLTGAGGAPTCGRHPLGGTGAESGVAIAYTTTGPETFDHDFPQSVAPPDLATGLVGYWPADGDDLDAVGPADATAVGGVSYVASPWCTAWDFPSSPVSYLTLGDAASLGLTSEITVSLWVNFDGPGPAGASSVYIGLFANWDDYTQGTAGWAMGLSPTDATHFHPGFSVTSTGSDPHGAGTSTDLVNGTWTHLVGVYDGAEVRLYVDGARVATTPHTGPIFDPAITIEINAVVRPGGTLHSMVGQLDELKVWDRGFDDATVSALYDDEVGGRACP